MSKSNILEEQWLDLYFNGTAIPDIAQNDTTAPATTLEVSLHTASPGEGGTKLTNEATYTGYARVQVNRNTGGWIRAGSSMSPVLSIAFPIATSGPETITYMGIGPPGNDILHWYGTITPNIVIPAGGGGVQPTLRGNDNPPASTITED